MLARLGRAIDWRFVEAHCGSVYTDAPGHPPLPTRLKAGLAILKSMHDLSDDALCDRWVENPYYQLFCGEEFIGAGNQVSDQTIVDASQTTTRIFLSDVLVEASSNTKTVVAFGDSITDGAASGMDLNARWPDFLAENLVSQNVAVVNAGISGAQVLNSRMGENAAARFMRDVISRPNVKTVVLLMGINDISWPGQSFGPDDPFLTRDELVSGYRQLIALAHAHNIRVVAGTLTPFRDALNGSPLEGYYSEKRDALRQEINAWIRESKEFDAVVDLDKLLADPQNPLNIREDLQADHLHLSPKGNKLLADALTPAILFGE